MGNLGQLQVFSAGITLNRRLIAIREEGNVDIGKV